MSFTVSKRGGRRLLRTQAYVAHARIGAGVYLIAAVLVVAILPTIEIPQFLAALILIPLIWNQYWRRGWYLALDDDGFTETLNREDGIQLRWDDLAGFRVIEHEAPVNLLFLGRGDQRLCLVVEAVPQVAEGEGEPQILWATAGYGEAITQPDAREHAGDIAAYLEARRAEATSA